MANSDRRGILMPVIVSAAVIVGVLIGLWAGRTGVDSRLRAVSAQLDKGSKLDYALSLIGSMYVDPVDTDSLVEQLMPDLMWYLDPHSVYIPASELSAVNESLEGEFDGIGVVFNMTTDTVVVLNVIPQGPSQKAGVQNGDRIIRIDDSLVAGVGIDRDAVMKMLRGKRGTKVRLGLERTGVSEPLSVTVTRGTIPVRSVDAAFMVRPGVGFVRITSFSQNTYRELAEALSTLSGEGMRSLIIDLRGNPGGYLGQAVAMANEFLPDDRLIVYTEDRNGYRNNEYSDGRGRYADMELAVILDEHSASSSEIFAGALQDNDRATVVGRRSFGKGLVQQQIPFPDGSAMRLTTARYFTPTGRSIQKPYSAADGEYEEELLDRYMHNELFSVDSIRFDDSLRFTTPGGRVVYGGGGIMPDVFVPLDTMGMTSYYIDVVGKNILFRYTMEYSDRFRRRLNDVGSVAELEALLDGGDLFGDFVFYAARQGVPPDPEGTERARGLLTALLRAYIGRNSPLEEAGFYSQYYVADPPVLKALEILENNVEDEKHASDAD